MKRSVNITSNKSDENAKCCLKIITVSTGVKRKF